MARPRLLRKVKTAPAVVHETEDALPPEEIAAQAAIDAHNRVVAVLKEFTTENAGVLTQLSELLVRAEATEAAAKKAAQAVHNTSTWTYGDVTKGKKPATPVFDVQLLPAEVLMTPGVIKTIDNAKLEKMATGVLAPYAEQLAKAKGPNPKQGSVSFSTKLPAATALKKLLTA